MSTSILRFRSRTRRTALAAATLVSLAALAGGCSTTGTSDVDPSLYDHQMRHPIMVSNEPEVLDIPVGMNGPALSRQIDRAIQVYLQGYRENGTGSIAIQVPVGSANEIAAGSTGRAVHYALVRAGVPHSRIDVAPYFVGDHAKVASVRLAYLRVKAVVPTCGVWPETTPTVNENTQYYNFGCAGQQNLAAMVANPADLVAPQPMSASNGARRALIIKKYSEGEDPKSSTQLIPSGVGSD